LRKKAGVVGSPEIAEPPRNEGRTQEARRQEIFSQEEGSREELDVISLVLAVKHI